MGLIKSFVDARAALATGAVGQQKRVCAEQRAVWKPPAGGSIVGVARNVGPDHWPLNGLRHRAEGNTCGWYLWAGEGKLSQDPDYFEPVHASHLKDRCPEALQYLGLPPGWRFLIAPGYSDVWNDPGLLNG